MAESRINPTLFDKLVSGLDMQGFDEPESGRGEASRSTMRYYSAPRVDRFNERALRQTVMRELNWLLNTTSLESLEDLEPYPQVRTSVLNYGVRDLAGKTLTRSVVAGRAKQIRDAIRAFEPRLEPTQLDVEALTTTERENAVTYVIRGDVVSAVQAMPVEFKTDVELDTAAVTLRE
ncbi:MAG TPA: type VI secretion system baseplate subunit TssE [Caulobacteraceae bacterium]|jgi:type VI secretion system protein ImpF